MDVVTKPAKTNRQLRNKILKDCLKLYIVPVFLKMYEAIGIRVLMEDVNVFWKMMST